MLLEKQKRIEEGLVKECSQVKERQKQLKNQLSRKEVQFTKLKLQLENINEKLLQTRETIKIDHPQKMYSTHHYEEWEESKMASMIEAQKYLEMDVINQKRTISELESQLARSR